MENSEAFKDMVAHWLKRTSDSTTSGSTISQRSSFQQTSAKRDRQIDTMCKVPGANKSPQIENRSEESRRPAGIVSELVTPTSIVLTWKEFTAKRPPAMRSVDRHAVLMTWIGISAERFKVKVGRESRREGGGGEASTQHCVM